MAKRKRFQKLKEMAQKPKKRRARARRRRTTITKTTTKEVRELRGNPPLLTDLAEYVIPGFGGFVATKFVANLAAAQIAKRWPRYARHAGALASVGSFLSAWWLGHRLRLISRWHSPLTVGSAMATAHNLVQLYFPDKLAWIVGSPKQAAIAAAVNQQAQLAAAQQAANPPAPELPDHLEEVDDDPSWYTFNDAYDAGRMKAPAPAVAAVTAQIEDQPSAADLEDEELASGLFANSGFGSEANLEN